VRRRGLGPVFIDECLANSRRRGKTRYFPRVCGTFKERAGWMTVAFPDRETEKRAHAFLIGRFSGRVLRSGEHLVPEAALEAFAA
jgi:hypothetical protein